MYEENNTSEALLDESQLNSANADETVTPEDPLAGIIPEAKLSGLSLDELNETLGKQFKDKESALKAMKDTFSYVGKKVEQVESDLKNKGFISQKDLEEVLFYRDNPTMETYKEVITAYANKHGITSKEALKSEALSGLFAKAQKADTFEKNQSVIESNPRFVASKSGLDKARELTNKRGQSDNVSSLVAKAVLDAYEN